MGRGRPPLPLGTAGLVRFVMRGSVWLARAQIRDYDGTTREIARTGKTRNAARLALAEAVRDRQVDIGADLSPSTRVSEVAEAWWTSESKDWSPNSRRAYRGRLDNIVLPALGRLQVRELTVGRIDRHVQAVAEHNGAPTAKMVRSILSGICGYATRNDILERNLVRDVGRVTGAKTGTKDSFSVAQIVDLRAKLAADPQACARDIPALIDFLLVTSLRIAESLPMDWDDFDLDAGTVRVGRKIVVRETGKPLYVSRHASHKLTPRELELPKWYVTALKTRRLASTGPLVFPSPKGKLRDPSNTGADLSDALAAAGYGWATAHTFRRTLLTWMHEAGLTDRGVADQAGHSRVSMAQDHYVARGKPTGAKELLEQLLAAS